MKFAKIKRIALLYALVACSLTRLFDTRNLVIFIHYLDRLQGKHHMVEGERD